MRCHHGRAGFSLWREGRPARTRPGEQGGIILEAALVIPILFMIFLVLVDIFFLANAFMGINQMVREGILTASNLTEIEPPDTPVSNIDLSGGEPVNHCQPSAGTDNCGHYRVQWRMEDLRNVLKLKRITIDTVETEYAPSTKIFRLMIRSTFQGISPFFRNYVFTVQARGVSRVE